MLRMTIKEWMIQADTVVHSLPTKDYRLYVLRDGEAVFYVGQSNNPHNRLLSHLGLDGRGGLSAIGRFILKNAPASDAWLFEQYTVEEVMATFEKSTPTVTYVDEVGAPLWLFEHYRAIGTLDNTDTAEKLLIAHYRPCFNKVANPNPAPLPEKYREQVRRGPGQAIRH